MKYNANLAINLKAGDVVMLPSGRALYDERQGNNGKDDPEGLCLQPGVPRVNGIRFLKRSFNTGRDGDPVETRTTFARSSSRATRS